MNCNKCEKVAKTWYEEWPVPNDPKSKIHTINLISMDKNWMETIYQYNSIHKILKHIEQLKKTKEEATKRIFIDSVTSIWYSQLDQTPVGFDISMMRNVCMNKEAYWYELNTDQYWNENGELNQIKFHQLKCKRKKYVKCDCYHCKKYDNIRYDNIRYDIDNINLSELSCNRCQLLSSVYKHFM